MDVKNPQHIPQAATSLAPSLHDSSEQLALLREAVALLRRLVERADADTAPRRNKRTA